MANSMAQYLDEGKKCGFSTIEVFREKIFRQEFNYLQGEEATVHEKALNRMAVRAFWENGDPVGFSLSNPDLSDIKTAFSAAYTAHLPNRDQVRNIGSRLPSSVKRADLAIFDNSVDSVSVKDYHGLMDLIEETLSNPAFADLKVHKVFLSKSLTKRYLANSNGLDTKYIKSLFNLQMTLGVGENRIDVSQTRIFFTQLDPLRLISRGLNLLYSLTERQLNHTACEDIYLILAPEVSAFLLKEFSDYFKTKIDPEMKKIRYPAILNVVDDPSLDGHAGSVPYDDEGVQTIPAETFLIRKGELKKVITNLDLASRHNSLSTGNGFRSQHTPFPTVRFTNLYIKPTVLPLKNLRENAANGVVVSLAKLKTIDHRGYLFSAYGYRFRNGQMEEPVHFFFRTSFRSYWLNILKVSSEIKFFHSINTIGSPYVLVKAAGKPGNLLEV